ncbi:MAG: low molecular weight phosphotyrosine protein phosphatase, partial [Gelidibacter sp.]|nr:low molecular weight phosphotyrosine protein phosphatase [Gelidibacter sp.]
IYVMDESNYKDVLKIARHQDDISKVKLILHKVEAASSTDVPDPYWGNQEDFEYVFNLLHDACENIAKQLQKQN